MTVSARLIGPLKRALPTLVTVTVNPHPERPASQAPWFAVLVTARSGFPTGAGGGGGALGSSGCSMVMMEMC